MPKKKTPQKSSPVRAPADFSEMNDISSPSDDEGNDILFDSVDSNVGVAVGGLGDVVGSVGGSTGSVPGVPAERVVYVRVSDEVHAEWVLVAEGEGVSLSEFVRQCVGPVVDAKLRCVHPVGFRQAYPWSEFCLKCGVRLR